MPASSGRTHLAALVGYVCVAIAFAWPLPLHLATALPGPVSGDTGVYVWNLWVFRHEIVAHHQLPFSTFEILSLTPRVPLTLHNYTTFANILAFPLLPLLGTIATFNLLMISSGALSAYAMFVWARRSVGDAVAAWVAGLAFGFAPFMSARATGHFSLVQTAPIPIFAMLFERLHRRPSPGVAAAAGATVAWAFLCDPYYAVYCLLIALFSIGYSAVVVERNPSVARGYGYRAALDIALVCFAGLIVGIVLRGGGRVELFGVRVSMTRLYTPVLLFTVLSIVRLWSAFGPRVRWTFPATLPPLRLVATAGLAGAVVLSPLLTALSSAAGESQWANPKVFWRSSAAGLDLLAFLLPNPMHPWFRDWFAAGLRSMPGGVENVGSIPFTLIVVIAAAALLARTPVPRYWIAFSAFFAILALGPFIQIAGRMTYVPTPWALLRYVPVVGAARMPSRMIVLVTLGLAMLLAFALRDLRAWAPRRAILTCALTGLLLFELLPAPRALHAVTIPWFYKTIAADPRPVKVMNLPFGLRDGLSPMMGNTTPANQFYQIFHEKQLVGGYISRLPRRDVAEYRRRRVTRALMDLSEGLSLTDERRKNVIARARETMPSLNIGYVVVNTDDASAELVAFAREAFDLTLVGSDRNWVLYRTPLASPLPN